MKRSKSISLLLMGSLVAASYGCSSEPEVQERFDAFATVTECVDSGEYTFAECQDFAKSAEVEVPKFDDKTQCEQQFGEGACESKEVASTDQNYQNRTSSWMPMMMGFMAGRYLGNSGAMQGSQPLFRQSGSSAGTQAFRTASGATVTPDRNGRITSPSADLKKSAAYNAKPAAARTSSVSSGGFSNSRTGSVSS